MYENCYVRKWSGARSEVGIATQLGHNADPLVYALDVITQMTPPMDAVHQATAKNGAILPCLLLRLISS